MPKYPNIKVKLTGRDGNAFAILGNVCKALRKHKVPSEEVQAFQKQAMSGNYEHLLCTCCEWVEVR